jgi:hypothetical protein
MAKKRSVPVEETETKARVDIQRALLLRAGGPVQFYARLREDRRKWAMAILKEQQATAEQIEHFLGHPMFSSKRDKYWRDKAISRAVMRGVKVGLKATRGRHQRYTNGAHSACSLVAEELKVVGIHMTEDAVEKIWRASEKAGLSFSDGK